MMRRAIGLLLLGAAALVGVASGAPATAGSTALLGRYEPVVELYRADWKPTAIEPFLAAADLERLAAGRWRGVRHSPPASALAGGSPTPRLHTRGCPPPAHPDSFHGLAGIPHAIPTRCSGIRSREPGFPSTQTSFGPSGTAPNALGVVDISNGRAPWLSFAGPWGDGSYVLLRAIGGKTTFAHLRV